MASHDTDDDSKFDTQWMLSVAMAPELSDREKALRDLFCAEFLVDEHPIKAALRCGFQEAFAKEYAARFMNEPYVQRKIQDLKHAPVDMGKMEEYDKQTVRAVLRREMQNEGSTGAARVQAAAKMASILGMDKPVEVKNEHTHKGGVLMVPTIANINDWEAAAVASQAQLASDARH
jgi:hypothetical protein